jgi:hypothetical protein
MKTVKQFLQYGLTTIRLTRHPYHRSCHMTISVLKQHDLHPGFKLYEGILQTPKVIFTFTELDVSSSLEILGLRREVGYPFTVASVPRAQRSQFMPDITSAHWVLLVILTEILAKSCSSRTPYRGPLHSAIGP